MTTGLKKQYQNLKTRSLILKHIRDFFTSNDYLEVETPVRCPSVIPEAHIDPLLSEGWYLQASPELCMKRLISNGFHQIFQISKCFRKNERGKLHLPEMTMLEWYTVGDTYIELMNQCQDLIQYIAIELGFNGKLKYKNKIIDLTQFKKITVKEAFSRYGSKQLEQALTEDAFDEIMSFEIEPCLGKTSPVFIYDYPASCASLAKLKDDNKQFSQRFEFYIAGIELANGFTELNDTREQRDRFGKENRLRAKTGKEPCPIPELFLKDLQKMPETAGIALGIDRLTMLFCNTDSIDEVVTFTPENL